MEKLMKIGYQKLRLCTLFENIPVSYMSVFCFLPSKKFFGPSSLYDINLLQYIVAKYPPAAPSSPLLSAYYLSHESAVWTKQSWLEHQPICKMEDRGEGKKYTTVFLFSSSDETKTNGKIPWNYPTHHFHAFIHRGL